MNGKFNKVMLQDFLVAIAKSIDISGIKLSESGGGGQMRLTRVSASITLNILPSTNEKVKGQLTECDGIIVDFSGKSTGNTINMLIEYGTEKNERSG